MSFPHAIFKAYDIRGVVEDTLTYAMARHIGRAIGSDIKSGGGTTVTIGHDGRLSSVPLSQHLTRGLRQSGINVVDIGLASTPMVYFASKIFNIPSCVAITGSHNPPHHNGFKIVSNGVVMSGQHIQLLKHRILNHDYYQGEGEYSQASILDRYLKEITNDITIKKKLKIVIDCGNGVAALAAPRLFKALQCTVIELFCDIDGRFPNHHPDPSQPQNLTDLMHAVHQHHADLGIAFDGDGDRLGVVNGNGEIIWPDRQMILFARDILANYANSEIIYDVKCTRQLPLEIAKAGGKATMSRTGHSFIKAKLKDTGALLGGEMSGHIFFNDRWYGFDDGIYAGARLIELLSNHNDDPEQIFATLPDSANTPELHLHFSKDGEQHRFIEQLQKRIKFADTVKVTTIDGLRADYSDGFGLIRASNTLPIVVLRFEGDNNKVLKRIQEEFRQLLLQIDHSLTLPF